MAQEESEKKAAGRRRRVPAGAQPKSRDQSTAETPAPAIGKVFFKKRVKKPEPGDYLAVLEGIETRGDKKGGTFLILRYRIVGEDIEYSTVPYFAGNHPDNPELQTAVEAHLGELPTEEAIDLQQLVGTPAGIEVDVNPNNRAQRRIIEIYPADQIEAGDTDGLDHD